MTDYISLIKDENETRRFIEKVLQPLQNDEVYIAVLTARKKYCPTISSSMEVVSRDIIRNNDTNKIMRKLKKMSIVEGLYTDKNEDIIPNEAFALYILPEPRSMLKAYTEFVLDINKWLYESLKIKDPNLELYKKLDLKLFSAIHRSKSKSKYFIIDIDKKDEKLLKNIFYYIQNLEDKVKGLHNVTLKFNGYEIINENIRWISETHGGYHIILDRNNETGKIIPKIMERKLEFVEFRKETMTPVVGISQGGFVVKEYKL